MSFHVPEACRIRTGSHASDASYGNNGAFDLGRGMHAVASDCKEWRPIKGYVHLYEVSNYGEVRALPKYVELPNNARRRHELSVLVGELQDDGYPRVTLCDQSGQHKRLVHRLVAEAFIANPNGFEVVNHRDGDKSNCLAPNLEWCTVEYNIHHAIENGFVAGFTATQIEEIRAMLDGGMSATEIATMLGKARQTIGAIKAGRHRDLHPREPSRYDGLPLWEHVSVSFWNRTPTWDEMCQVKRIFWDDEDCVVQYHPRKSQFRQLHPHCLHLWRCIDRPFPEPLPEMIA